MRWLQKLNTMRMNLIKYHESELEEHSENQKRRVKMKLLHDVLVIKRREYRKKLRLLERFPRHGTSTEQLDLTEKVSELDSQIQDIQLQIHINAYPNGDENFNRYYRHIRNTRPYILIFNLVLWFVLFRFGGVGIGLKLVILFIAFATTFGSLFEMFFLTKIKDRILKPIDNLIKGVNEIAKGNTEVTVNNDNTNEISSLIKAFNEMALKLHEGELLKAEYEDNRKALLANISHDLKTPITSIQGYVEMINSKLPSVSDQHDNPTAQNTHEDVIRYLKIVYNNADYMNRLIDDLFLFSKLDMQKLDFHFEEIQLRPFIKDMMEEFSLDLIERKVKFEYNDVLTTEYIVKLDAKRFFQILRNIIGNAVIHGPASELSINVKLYEEDGFISIDIADNGSGISAEHLEHIFERFYRVEVERTKTLSSTGLGLAIAKELILAHGGQITVSSVINEGTCFTLKLPFK